MSPARTRSASTLEIEYKVGLGLDAGRGRYLPEAWPEGTTRKAWGEIQNKLWGVYDARVKYESAITKYQNQIEKIEEEQAALEDKADDAESRSTITRLVMQMSQRRGRRHHRWRQSRYALILNRQAAKTKEISMPMRRSVCRTIVGMANDVTFLAAVLDQDQRAAC